MPIPYFTCNVGSGEETYAGPYALLKIYLRLISWFRRRKIFKLVRIESKCAEFQGFKYDCPHWSTIQNTWQVKKGQLQCTLLLYNGTIYCTYISRHNWWIYEPTAFIYALKSALAHKRNIINNSVHYHHNLRFYLAPFTTTPTLGGKVQTALLINENIWPLL